MYKPQFPVLVVVEGEKPLDTRADSYKIHSYPLFEN